MKVYIREQNFGQFFDIFFINDGPGRNTIIRPHAVEGTEVTWLEEEVGEYVLVDPSMRINRAMLDALKEALRDNVVTVDEEMIRRLKLEEGRVDRMLTYLMEGTH